METKDKNYSKELIGKTIVSKSGKKFGEVEYNIRSWAK